MNNNSGFDNRMNQATQNAGNNQNTNIHNAQSAGNLAKDSDLYKKSAGLGSKARRDDSKGISSSSKSPSSGSTGGSNSLKNSSRSTKSSGNMFNNPMRNMPANKNNRRNSRATNALASTGVQAMGIPKPVADKMVNSKLGQRLIEVAKKRNWKLRAFDKLTGGGTPKEGKVDAPADAANPEQGDPTEPANKRSENSVEEISIRIPFKVKIALLVSTCTLGICMLLLMALINTDTIQKIIVNRMAAEIFYDPADIQDGHNSGEWIRESTYISRDANIYLKTNYIDDDIKSPVELTTYTSSKDVDLTALKEYYKINCTGDECEKTELYKFYRKLYDIYFMYKYKYHVNIDLPLLTSTLDYNTKSHEDMFHKNQGEYDIDGVRENDYDNENTTILDWENDFKKLDGYKYLNANDYRYDMQILAKNMVKKKIKYKCIKGNGSNDDGDSANDESSKIITDNKSKGNGWDSVTKMTYPNGTERTFRNYKQYNNGNNDYWNYPYWGGNIANSGCGPSSIAIIMSGYGYADNPRDVVKRMAKLKFYYTNPYRVAATLKSYKFDVELKSWTANSEKEIKDNFDAGRPIIVGVTNHYVTYLGLNKKGKLIISDPGKRDGQNSYYGATIADLKRNYTGHQYILIKSDGNASKKQSSLSMIEQDRKNYLASSNKTKGGAGKVIKKSNYNSKGGYSGIYESRTTGKRFKEYKQNSSWAISTFPNVAWKQECGKISALTIGSGYSDKATYSHLYNNILNKGKGNATVHGIIDTYTKTNVDFQPMISISKLKKYLSKGYVASIHVSGYPRTSTHFLSILDINKSKTKIYLSDPWGGTSYNGWKNISIVNSLGAHEICLVSSDGKTINYDANEKQLDEKKIFYIGDSWIEALDNYRDAKSPSSYFYHKIGMNANWVLSNYSKAQSDAYKNKSLKQSIPKDSSAIVVSFGLNGPSLWNKTQELVDKLKKDYPKKEIFVLQTPHVTKEYTSGGVNGDKLNSDIDKYNSKMKSYCDKKSGVTFINPTTNIVSNKGKGYLKKTYADGEYHLNHSGDKIWYRDIINGIKNNLVADSDSSSDSNSSEDGEYKTAEDVETKNYDTDLKCDDGDTLDKDSIEATYKLDKEKYDEFLLEYLEHKFYLKGSEVKEDETVKDDNYVKGLKFLDSNFGKIVYYNQGDYRGHSYGSYGTIASHGCGPTSLAIVISSFTKQKHDPVEITNYVCSIGGCTSAGTTWAAITKTPQKYGLKVQSGVSDKQKILDALGSGKSLVIASMGRGHFTNSGHFIVLTGTKKNGKVTVADPGHRDNCKAWDFNIIAREGKQFWIISK